MIVGTKLVQTEDKAKKASVFLSFVEVRPNLGEAKVQTEDKAKKASVFLSFVEVQPNLGEAKVQTEDKAKKCFALFFCPSLINPCF